jgi:uncharacterized membrane protein YoaK (UPF0700 family)
LDEEVRCLALPQKAKSGPPQAGRNKHINQLAVVGARSIWQATYHPCIGYRADLLEDSFQPFELIALTALAMGTRNAAVRKLAIPDLTTTVLTLTITGIGADSSLANGNKPRLARRVASVAAMFLGAAWGAVAIHYSISAALWLATAISAVCGAALLRSVRTSDKP